MNNKRSNTFNGLNKSKHKKPLLGKNKNKLEENKGKDKNNIKKKDSKKIKKLNKAKKNKDKPHLPNKNQPLKEKK